MLNDGAGVLIRATGARLGEFLAALGAEAPPLARVDAIEARPARVERRPFRIAPSAGGTVATRVTPDAATCPACLAEIRGTGRRHGYAFTNCTHCGPRYTILRELPYDRARTSMAPFPMCPDCRAEYEDPADRRFHAQPIACPACGPRLWLEAEGICLVDGPVRAEGAEAPQGVPRASDPVAEAARLLAQGGILAVKGLGGFHLACDARDRDALRRLRLRKRRPGKPFALMATEEMAAEIADPAEADRVLLRDPAAPVVLVRGRRRLPEEVAPGMTTLGIMRPYTPLHHRLIEGLRRAAGHDLGQPLGRSAGHRQWRGAGGAGGHRRRVPHARPGHRPAARRQRGTRPPADGAAPGARPRTRNAASARRVRSRAARAGARRADEGGDLPS